MTEGETPIAKCEVLKTEYSQKKGGTFVTFMISENPDNVYDGLAMLALGDVVNLYITKVDMGA